VRFETKIVVTDVSEREELLGQIEALSPDLVVVGRRGLGALAKCVVSPVFSF
jgi:nucleotide-binding universal stress UspA family protein